MAHYSNPGMRTELLISSWALLWHLLNLNISHILIFFHNTILRCGSDYSPFTEAQRDSVKKCLPIWGS